MGIVCTKNKKHNSIDDDGDYRLRKTTTLNEIVEKNFPKGAFYYNKQEEK